MAMNDTETVALIGGGHAFGKTHGACPAGAGPSPKEDPENPWPGKCGSGKGKDAFTSGFEGPWTAKPTEWDNTYFKNLVEYDFESAKGPGGHYQWKAKKGPHAPAAHGEGSQPVMMLTSDMSLVHDAEFKKLVEKFAKEPEALDVQFAHAWYKLTTRDMGPYERCVGDLVPPPQPFQHPLPRRTAPLPDFGKVGEQIEAALKKDTDAGPLLVRLAWQCASTFRSTDYQGGCNGARIRFSPEKDWPVNKALDSALELLEPIKAEFGAGLSWADLIVLGGNVALERAGAPQLNFCPGRTDATDGTGSAYVAPRMEFDGPKRAAAEVVKNVRDALKISGLSPREFVALSGGHSLGAKHERASGLSGSWDATPAKFDNLYFQELASQQFEAKEKDGKVMYVAGSGHTMLATDIALKWDPELFAIVEEYAADEAAWKADFAAAWTKMMNADRFDGPAGNVCDRKASVGEVTM